MLEFGLKTYCVLLTFVVIGAVSMGISEARQGKIPISVVEDAEIEIPKIPKDIIDSTGTCLVNVEIPGPGAIIVNLSTGGMMGIPLDQVEMWDEYQGYVRIHLKNGVTAITTEQFSVINAKARNAGWSVY